jgi:hypothetical protein
MVLIKVASSNSTRGLKTCNEPLRFIRIKGLDSGVNGMEKVCVSRLPNEDQ